MSNILLNLGCSDYKLNGFTNIDFDPNVQPEICMDLNELGDRFEENSVDFIFAGHVFEHFKKEDSQKLINACYKILKPHRTLLAVVPDYTKCSDIDIETAERVIMAHGDHLMLYNKTRLREMLRTAGFHHAFHIEDLKEIPYLLVANVLDPKPDLWQTGFMALKI